MKTNEGGGAKDKPYLMAMCKRLSFTSETSRGAHLGGGKDPLSLLLPAGPGYPEAGLTLAMVWLLGTNTLLFLR